MSGAGREHDAKANENATERTEPMNRVRRSQQDRPYPSLHPSARLFPPQQAGGGDVRALRLSEHPSHPRCGPHQQATETAGATSAPTAVMVNADPRVAITATPSSS